VIESRLVNSHFPSSDWNTLDHFCCIVNNYQLFKHSIDLYASY